MAAYSPLWGTNPVGAGLDLVTAAASLAEGRVFPVPRAEAASPGLDVLAPGPLPRDGAIRCAAVTRQGRGHFVTVRGPEAARP